MTVFGYSETKLTSEIVIFKIWSFGQRKEYFYFELCQFALKNPKNYFGE